MKYALVIPFTCLLAGACWGQPSFSLSAPVFWGNIQVKDNWTPSTAPHYKEYRTGSQYYLHIDLQSPVYTGSNPNLH